LFALGGGWMNRQSPPAQPRSEPDRLEAGEKLFDQEIRDEDHSLQDSSAAPRDLPAACAPVD
jgi:hypothetical protein